MPRNRSKGTKACKTHDGGIGNVSNLMDTQRHADVAAADRGRKMGVAGGRRCTDCGVIVHWRVEKFCLDQPQRFGRRIYCIRCQAKYRTPSPTP